MLSQPLKLTTIDKNEENIYRKPNVQNIILYKYMYHESTIL